MGRLRHGPRHQVRERLIVDPEGMFSTSLSTKLTLHRSPSILEQVRPRSLQGIRMHTSLSVVS